jgi:hypothetical protein
MGTDVLGHPTEKILFWAGSIAQLQMITTGEIYVNRFEHDFYL